ncbi:MAG: phage/plasmid primase, P4 family [Armatimonadota bacterium]
MFEENSHPAENETSEVAGNSNSDIITDSSDIVNPASKLEHAIALAEAGLYVFPLHSPGGEGCTCGKPDCTSVGKHPITSGWQNIATRDPEEIKGLWGKYPEANIGIVSGEKYDTFVLDIDGQEGEASLFNLEIGNAKLPVTWTSVTGNGKHLIYSYPKGRNLRNKTRFRTGLDCRSDGGLIVGPGSLHASGSVYKWEEGKSPSDIEKAELPTWIIDIIESSAARGKGGGFSLDTPHEPPEAPYNSCYYWLEKALEKAKEGNRNDTGFWLAGQLLDNIYQFEKDEESLLEVMCHYARTLKKGDSPYRESEAVASFYSALNYRLINGFRQPAGKRFKPIPCTDNGNSERFVRDHGKDARYVTKWKMWILWDGTRWVLDETSRVEILAKQTARGIHREVEFYKGDELSGERSRILRWQAASESKNHLDNMISLARPELAIKPEELDSDPNLLAVKNGILDLRTGELLEPHRENLITKQVPVTYDPEAKCPEFSTFLETVVPDEEARQFIQTAVGYSLTGITLEQCLFFLYGEGRNGKSTFIETISSLLGDYSAKTRSETLMIKRNGDVSDDIAALRGARLVTVSEISDGQRLNEGRMKDITGGDRISARFLYGKWFEFNVGFKLWFYGNHKPTIKGKDEGIWRRIRLIPFTVQIPEDKCDKNLKEKLYNELPGILNWALEGLRRWHKEGFKTPKAVASATKEYKAGEDSLSNFMEDCCVLGKDKFVTKADMWTAYILWANRNGEEIYEKRNDFQKELLRHPGIKEERSNTARWWKGIDLTAEWKKEIEGRR